MKSQSNIRVLSFLRASVIAASLVVVGVGLVVLSGWIMDISTFRSILPGLPAIRFNTALSLLLMGSSLWLLQNEEASHAQKGLGKVLAGLALLISLLTLSEYLFRWDVGIDELFIRDLHSSPDLFPGRMSPIAVLCSGLSSTALLLIGSRISQYFSIGVIVLSLVAILDFLFDFRFLSRNPQNTYSAVQTAGAFFILSLALIAARPTQGMMKLFSSNLPGSKTMRLLLPGIVILTIVMGWLVEMAENAGFLDTSKESIFLVILLIFVYSPLIHFIARNINRAEEGIIYANRLYATLSQVNQTIVRVKDRDDLYQSICDVAVQFGEFSLAWVGLLDEASGEIKPAAANGLDLAQWPFQNVDIKKGLLKDGLIATAIRTSRVVTSEDIQADARMPGLQTQFQKYGYHSSAAVPFRLRGRAIGVLSLVSSEVGLFKAGQEVRLLEEMGLDISFALDTMETEAERKQVEVNLQDSEARYRSLFTNILSGYAYCQMLFEDGKPLDFIYINVNEMFEKLTGLKDVAGKRVSELIPGIKESNPELFETYGRVAVTGKPEKFETYIDSLGIWFSISVYSPKPGYFVAVFENITEQKQVEDELRTLNDRLEQRVVERAEELYQTNAELERANRAKDEFLATMSHELRTPLNSILGLSESLLEERRGVLNDYQQKSLQIIETSGHHLLELINDILDLSKIEAGKLDFYPQLVSVDELCRSSLGFVKAQAAKKSIAVTYTNQSAVAEIDADARRLKQILVNLLTNSVKFTPANGEVTLQVNTYLEQNLIQFSVIDTGVGIAPKDLQRLFQPFVQVDSSLNRQYEGTGLGLALVQKLTDLHGGSVQVESEVGKGSRFTINLACKLDNNLELGKPKLNLDFAGTEQMEKTGAFSEVSTHRGVILLAEDNMPNILTIGEYVESHGYEVIVAHDGLEAIKKAEEVKPDLILMDIQMPAMNGLEAIAHLRADSLFAFTPIIALTALAMPGDRERCLNAGANEYMSKPVSLKLLVKVIARLLEHESE